MEVFFVILGCIVAFYILRYILNSIVNIVKANRYANNYNKTDSTVVNSKPLNSIVTEPNISFEEMRNYFFEKWSLSLQCNSEQRKRLERARADTVYMLFNINPDNGTAGCYSSNYNVTGRVYDVTYKHCTCPDFEKRGLPCKHIYALNVNMGIIKEDEDLSGIPSNVKEKMKLLPPENESYFWSLLRRNDFNAFLVKRSRSSKPLLALELIKDTEKPSVLLNMLFSRNDLVAKIYEGDIEYKPSPSTTKSEIIDYLLANEPDFVKKIIKNDMLVVFDDEVVRCKQKICDYYMERTQSSQQQ